MQRIGWDVTIATPPLGGKWCSACVIFWFLVVLVHQKLSLDFDVLCSGFFTNTLFSHCVSLIISIFGESEYSQRKSALSPKPVGFRQSAVSFWSRIACFPNWKVFGHINPPCSVWKASTMPLPNYNVMLLYLDAKTNAVVSKDMRQHGMMSSWHLTSQTMFTILLLGVQSRTYMSICVTMCVSHRGNCEPSGKDNASCKHRL